MSQRGNLGLSLARYFPMMMIKMLPNPARWSLFCGIWWSFWSYVHMSMKLTMMHEDVFIWKWCQAMGGFPPPHITWWIGTRQLQPQQTVGHHHWHHCHHPHHHCYHHPPPPQTPTHHHHHIPQKKEYQGVATSKLLYVPDIIDDGHYLTCRSQSIKSSYQWSSPFHRHWWQSLLTCRYASI